MSRAKAIPNILRKVGRIIIEKSYSDATYTYDKGYLAEADLLANKTIIQSIKDLFPQDKIISEEDESIDVAMQNNEGYNWIIDPICGTTNYLHNIPFYSHAISVCKENEIIAAGVYDPIRKELFFSDGESFFINECKYELKNNKKLSESLISFNTNQSNYEKDEESLNSIISKIGPPCTRRIHVLESANLELAYVAAGRLDAYFNPQDKPWDFAAAKLFMTTAGGFIKILNNEDKNILSQKGVLAAGSNQIGNQILSIL